MGKHSGKKKPFPKPIIAVAAAVAVIAIVVFAAVNLLTPKDFNGTITIDALDSKNEIQNSVQITVKDDKMTVNTIDSSGEIDKYRSYTATVAERSETETAYVFKLEDAKMDNRDEFLNSNYYDDVQFTLYIPKGMKGQKPEGFFGAIVRMKSTDNGKYFFRTSDLGSLPFIQFNADGKGTFLEVSGNNLENTDDVAKIDPTSESYDKDFGSSNVDADKETFKWEKRDNKLHCTWEGEDLDNFNNFDITVSE